MKIEVDSLPYTANDVKIGRLQKRIDKLTKQRDYFKERLNHYEKVISMQPYIESRYTSYQDKLKERERVKELEHRVKEQALLIEKLQK